jgi:MOSC domain-containing protein YiiM
MNRDPGGTIGFVNTVSVGRPETFGFAGAAAWYDEPWSTAIFKRPVDGPVRIGRLGLEGDGQVDLVNHGGPDKAICVYPGAHYPQWRVDLAAALQSERFADGAFGENLAVAGLSEDDVCIGDLYRLGAAAVVQVSQPRQPCWKLARKWRIKDLTARAVATGRTGWYFRVVNDGTVTAGDRLTLQSRPHPSWTIAAANQVMHHRQGDGRALAGLPELSASWKHTLGRRHP